MLAGTSQVRRSLRVAVTVTASVTRSGARTNSRSGCIRARANGFRGLREPGRLDGDYDFGARLDGDRESAVDASHALLVVPSRAGDDRRPRDDAASRIPTTPVSAELVVAGRLRRVTAPSRQGMDAPPGSTSASSERQRQPA